MIGQLTEIARRLAELERKVAASARQGVVSEVDAARGVVRIDMGDGMLSPWVPYSQAAGGLKMHTPPSVGQQMTLIAPSGEMEQGSAIPLSWSGDNASPGSDENPAMTFGNVRVDVREDAVVISIGGTTVRISSGGMAITGGTVSHDGKNIGASHVHGGVDRGGDETGTPQ